MLQTIPRSSKIPEIIEAIKVSSNAVKLRRIQRLINIKIAKAYRTTSHEAVWALTCNTPITIELERLRDSITQKDIQKNFQP